MQSFILRRSIRKDELVEVEVETFEEAKKELLKFMDEPIPDDCVIDPSLCYVEFVGYKDEN